MTNETLTFAFIYVKQVRYAATEIVPSKSARARGAYLRVSFKNTRETAQAINGWKLQRAVKFLENVKEKSEAVPMRRYCGSIGRTAQGTTRFYDCDFSLHRSWRCLSREKKGVATLGKEP